MPRPRSIDDATILDAAREVFVAKGPGATTREVAKRAGVSEGVLFQRYKTKTDLFFAALAPPAAEPSAVLPSGEEAVGNLAVFENAALEMLAYFRESMPLLLPLATHPSFDPESFFHREHPASLQNWIASLVDFLDLQPAPDSQAAATLLATSMFGVALIDTVGIHGEPMTEETIREMVRALWNGVVQVPAATDSATALGSSSW
jgi:AcrR family transcriptional regulator